MEPPDEKVAALGRATTGDQLAGRIEINNTPGHRPRVALALALDAKGWDILPCRATDLDAAHKSKAPWLRHGKLEASDNPAQIRAWWATYPDALIGARIPAALTAIEIDPRYGGSREGLETCCHRLFSVTLTVWSGRNGRGRHLYFHHRVGQLTSTRLPVGVDVKDNGYCIMPPSSHPVTGLPYRCELPPVSWMTPALQALIQSRDASKRKTLHRTRPAGTGARSAALMRVLAGAAEGQRNGVPLWAASRVSARQPRAAMNGEGQPPQRGTGRWMSLEADTSITALINDIARASPKFPQATPKVRELVGMRPTENGRDLVERNRTGAP